MFFRTIALITVLFAISYPRSGLCEETKKTDQGEFKVVLESGAVYVVQGAVREQLDLMAPAVAAHLFGQNLYIAMLEHGVAVYDLRDPAAPAMVRQIAVSHGKVTGFLATADNLWMKIDSATAVLLEGESGAAPALAGEVEVISVPRPIAEEKPSEKQGKEASAGAEKDFKQKLSLKEPLRILEIYPGKAKLNAGSKAGIEIGDVFNAIRFKQMDEEQNKEFSGREVAAMIEVIAVNEASSLALVARGDRVSINDAIEPADPDQRQSKVFPRRLPKIGEVGVVLRPLIKVGTPSGFGALCDVTASYWGKAFFADVRMQPLGFGWTKDGNVLTASVLGEGGYDGRAFAIGLGVGVATVNGDLDEMLSRFASQAASDDDGAAVEPKWSQRTQSAFAISQVVRLGARDGLNLSVYNLFLYHKDKQKDEAGFIYGGTSARFAFPLAALTDMYLEGGGGLMGYGFGAVGIFTWVRGSGDADSIGISVSAGAAGVWGNRKRTQGDTTEIETITIAGPMISFGLTYRFGFF